MYRSKIFDPFSTLTTLIISIGVSGEIKNYGKQGRIGLDFNLGQLDPDH
jgi:hypothetical protein